MCLAVPGRIVRQYETDETAMAEVDFGGVVKEVCLQYLPDARMGDYVIVHVGFAIQALDEDSAKATLANFETLGILEQEFGNDIDRSADGDFERAATAEGAVR
jgi:hydrogenase expression/formation protein HypC